MSVVYARALARDDLQDIDLFQILTWSPSRPLDPRRHNVVRDSTSSSEQDWFPPELINDAIQQLSAQVSGTVSEVTRFRIDHGETADDSLSYVLGVRPSSYAASLAVPKLLEYEEHWAPIRRRISSEGVLQVLGSAPQQSFFVALSVTTERGEVLKTRRSASAASGRGVWSLAVCETMSAPSQQPGHSPEDLFAVARRAAREELGLNRGDYGPIWFTWHGYGRRHGQFAGAHVRTRLEPHDVGKRALAAEGGWESDAFQWLPLGGPELKILTQIRLHDGWLSFTPIVARGVLSVWDVLDEEPTRT